MTKETLDELAKRQFSRQREDGQVLVEVTREELAELLRSARLALKAEAYLRLHGKELCMATALAANRSAKTREAFHPVGMELDNLMRAFGIE